MLTNNYLYGTHGYRKKEITVGTFHFKELKEIYENARDLLIKSDLRTKSGKNNLFLYNQAKSNLVRVKSTHVFWDILDDEFTFKILENFNKRFNELNFSKKIIGEKLNINNKKITVLYVSTAAKSIYFKVGRKIIRISDHWSNFNMDEFDTISGHKWFVQGTVNEKNKMIGAQINLSEIRKSCDHF